MATLAEVLEYGPIVAIDPDTGILVTVNGSYWNIWTPTRLYCSTEYSATDWSNVDAIATGRPEGMYGWDSYDMTEEAPLILAGYLSSLNPVNKYDRHNPED